MIRLLSLSSLLFLFMFSTFSSAVEYRDPESIPQPYANLTWTLPTTDVDGNPVTIQTLIVAYGLVSSSEPATEVNTEGVVDNWQVTVTEAGLYSFRVMAVDTVGTESDWSNEATALMSGVRVRPGAPSDLNSDPIDNIALHHAIDDCMVSGASCIADIKLRWKSSNSEGS